MADTIDIIQYNNIRYALSIHPSIPCPPRRPSTTLGASISQTKTATESVSSLRSTPSVLPGSTSTSTHGCWMMDDGPPPPQLSRPSPPSPTTSQEPPLSLPCPLLPWSPRGRERSNKGRWTSTATTYGHGHTPKHPRIQGSKDGLVLVRAHRDHGAVRAGLEDAGTVALAAALAARC